MVGVDGSQESWRGLAWASREAQAQQRPLRVVHAWEVPVPGYVPMPESTELVRDAAQSVLDDALEKVAEWAPRVQVTGGLVLGPAARVLIEEGRDAALVVSASHGRGGFARIMLGSTSAAAAAHAKVPTVVVRGEGHAAAWREGPVVVGVDGSAVSEAAVAFAFDAACRRGKRLWAVHAWTKPDPLVDEAYAVLAEPETRSTEARLALSESLAGWQDKYPDVTVNHVVSSSHPVEALLAEAHESDAALLVVGSRGRGGFTGLLLGSVSRGVVHHAPCPVAVVRPAADG